MASEHSIDRDVVADVELAEKGPGFERKVGEPANVRNRPATPPEVADVDLLIERPDLGPGAQTLVLAGSHIPPDLADYPRHPRDPKSKPKRG